MWSRIGTLRDNVRFLNSAETATLRGIRLGPAQMRNLAVSLVPASDCKETLINLCEKFLGRELSSVWDDEISLVIESVKSLNKLIHLLQRLDITYNRYECTQDIIDELSQAFFACEANIFTRKHKINEDCYVVNAQVNPVREESLALIDLTERQFSLKEFKQNLVEGENPNQRRHGAPSILFLLLTNNIQTSKYEGEPSDIIVTAVFLLICYGSNFLDSRNGFFFQTNAREYAYKHRNIDPKCSKALKIMHDAINYRDFQLTKKSPKHKPPVIEMEIEKEEKTIVTIKLKLRNKSTIQARLIRSDHLSSKDKESCYQIFKKYFLKYYESETHLKQEFEFVFHPEKNVLINLIFLKNSEDQEKLVGFNVFEIVQNRNNLTWHSWYTAMEPECRGAFTPFFAYGFAHAVQAKYPHLNIEVYFNPIEYNALAAMNVATELVATPKHQSAHVVSLVDDIHRKLKVYKNGVTVFHAQMTWCVKNNSPTVASPEVKSVNNNLMKRLFDEHFKIPNGEPIALYYVADQSVKEFDRCANELGIDTTYYLTRVGSYLSQYVFDITGIQPSRAGEELSNAYCSALGLFFLNERVPSANKPVFTSPQKLARL